MLIWAIKKKSWYHQVTGMAHPRRSWVYMITFRYVRRLTRISVENLRVGISKLVVYQFWEGMMRHLRKLRSFKSWFSCLLSKLSHQGRLKILFAGYWAIILVLGSACAFEKGGTRRQSRFQGCCLVIYGKAFTFLSVTFKGDTLWFLQFLDETSLESIVCSFRLHLKPKLS
jgi:hypothetical protein